MASVHGTSTVMSTVPFGTCGRTRLLVPGSNIVPAAPLWAWSTVPEESRLFVAAPSLKPNKASELTHLFLQRKLQRDFGDTLARSTAVQRTSGILDAQWGSVGSPDERKSHFRRDNSFIWAERYFLIRHGLMLLEEISTPTSRIVFR